MTNPNSWIRFGGLLVLALLLTAAVAWRAIELSILQGRLSVPPLYDDVSYFVEAARWLNAMKTQGLIADVSGLMLTHAPFSTLAAAIGLRLFPAGYVGLYIMHAAAVFGFLLGVIWLTRARPVIDSATSLIAASCIPVVWHTVTEGRPDLPLSLALGIAVGAVIHRDLFQRSVISLIVLGVGCGAAISVKPSAFPAAFACATGAFAVRLLFDCVRAGGLRASFRRGVAASLWFALGLFAAAALLLGPALRETITYIYLGIFELHDFWIDGHSFWVGLLRFSVGGEGQFALRYWLWIGLALIVLRILLVGWKDRAARYDVLVMLAAVLIAYTIPSLSDIKTYFFGAIFYGVFIVAMVLNYCACSASVAARLASFGHGRPLTQVFGLLPLAAVALLFGQYILLNKVTVVTVFTAQQQEDLRVGPERLWSLLRGLKVDPSSTISVGFTSPYPVTASTIDLWAAQANVRITARQEFFHRTVEATEQALLTSNILAVSSSMPHPLPGPRFGDELIKRMDTNKDVCLLDSIVFPDVTLRVYRRGC